MYINVNGINIYYEVMGRGKPIILLNPNSVNTNAMNYVTKKLSKDFLVYKFDRRCCGKSEKNCTLSYELSAKDVVEFISKLKIEKPYLLGSSGGGIVAMIVAITSPDIISKLVLCSTTSRLNCIKKPVYSKVLEKLPFYPGKKSAVMFEKLNSETKDLTVNDLKQIKAKTLVVNGGKKDVVPLTEANYIASSIPNAKKLILPNEGHFSYMINMKWYDKLKEFLDE